MTIRKKIVFSNILMIFIPIIVAIIVAGILLEGAENKYWETMEDMYEDKNSLYSAQSIIFAYKEELTKNDWIHYQSEDGNKKDLGKADLSKTKEMRQFEQELVNLGYNFSINVNGGLVFSNITEDENILMDKLVVDSYEKTDSLTMTSDETSIIYNSFYEGENKCEIAAIHQADNKVNKVNQSYFRKYILKYISFFVTCVLVVIILMNTLLSWWISRSILIPLKKLSIGSRKIMEGELDFQVGYSKSDEFGEVCRDFDEMRGHLKDSVEERLRYERYRTELLSGVSHDLRTPLTSIKGYAEGLMDGIADTSEKQKRYYKAIHTRAKDMEGLVDNLSTYTHLENGQNHYDFERVEFNSFLKKIVQEYHIDAANNKVKIQCDYSENKLSVNIDCQKMQRVFFNIFSNTIKYRIKDTSVITIETGQEGGYIIVRITDDGPGVNIEDLQHIFECFYRGDASRTRPGDGSGLGLSIVKQIVEGHHGKIKAENRGGLSITIWLPFCTSKNR